MNNQITILVCKRLTFILFFFIFDYFCLFVFDNFSFKNVFKHEYIEIFTHYCNEWNLNVINISNHFDCFWAKYRLWKIFNYLQFVFNKTIFLYQMGKFLTQASKSIFLFKNFDNRLNVFIHCCIIWFAFIFLAVQKWFKTIEIYARY